jgi:hypothetical protein
MNMTRWGGMIKTYKQADRLFFNLKAWSLEKDSFSINDFCKKRGIALSELKLMADDNSRLAKIVGEVICQLFSNALQGYERNEISRDTLSEYLTTEHSFEDPEFVIGFVEYEKDLKENEELVRRMNNVEKDPEGAFEAATKIIDKYGWFRF